MVSRIRAFIALEFNDECIKEVARVQEELGKKIFTGKMTELENLHLTLKFIGEIDEEMLGKVRNKLKEIKFKGFDGSLGDLGVFDRKKPRIVWIKVNGKEVWDLQKEIDKKLSSLFEEEERFMSHLTIARIKYVRDKKSFLEHLGNINVKNIKFKVEKFKLMKSELDEIGPKYECIEEYSCE